MIGLCVLGATGSVGLNTLDVVSRHPDRYRIVALTANTDVKRMASLCVEHRPACAVMVDHDAAQMLQDQLRNSVPETEVLSGVEALEMVAGAAESDYVMAAIVGAAGLLPSMAAARSGKRILLANKEALVMSGKLFMDEIERNSAQLLPIDSEHNAIFQCMPVDFEAGLAEVGVRRILLTASGGPFRERSIDSLGCVSPEEACAHPNWDMGRKISVDSATMMNKGLEIIEACWLFRTTSQAVQVVVHPQSVIHSMVEYVDGSVLAQLGNPDMRTPIAHALAWPERMGSGVSSLDLFAIRQLDFAPPDPARFPCLSLAREVIRIGGTCPAILNAANEAAVQAFLEHRLRFTDIPRVIEGCMIAVSSHRADSLEMILRDDRETRGVAEEQIQTLKKVTF